MKCPYCEPYDPEGFCNQGHCTRNGNLPSPWIDVREKLPDKDGLYLVFNKNYSNNVCTHYYYVGNEDNTGWYESTYYKAEKVTHWMPLPAAPEGE